MTSYLYSREDFISEFFVHDGSGLLYGEDDSLERKEMLKAQLCVDLMEKYQYAPECIWLRHLAKTDVGGVEIYTEADIMVLGKRKQLFIIGEVSVPEEFAKKLDVSVSKLFRLAQALNTKKGSIRFLLYYTRWYKHNRLFEKYITIDYRKFPTFEKWHQAGRPNTSCIPKNYKLAK